MTIIQALEDPHLFRPLFRDLSSWQAWVVWLKAVFALSMSEAEQALYQRCTGRHTPPTAEPCEVFSVVGRRGGKSFTASLTAVYLATFRDYTPFLSPGERAVVMVLARDRNQAGVIFRYIAGMLHDIPLLAQMIESERAEEIDLTNRVTIAVYTASFRSTRGVTIAAALCDEIAFWQVDGANPDREILAALRPAMATIAGAKLLCLSSPYARTGVLYDTFWDYYGKEGADVLVWRAPTTVMNPTIPQTFIERDPEVASSEWEALFREGLEVMFPLEVIEACVVPGRTILPPTTTLSYSAFADPSGGRSDAFTLAIGHKKSDGTSVIDCLKGWGAPFSPESIVREVCEWLRTYHVTRVVGDKYAGEWPREQFAKWGILYEEAPSPKSELYLSLLPALTSRQVELPEDAQLLRELQRLERRRGRSGKDTVDHPPNGHDDIANAVAGCCALVAQQYRRRAGTFGRQ